MVIPNLWKNQNAPNHQPNDIPILILHGGYKPTYDRWAPVIITLQFMWGQFWLFVNPMNSGFEYHKSSLLELYCGNQSRHAIFSGSDGWISNRVILGILGWTAGRRGWNWSTSRTEKQHGSNSNEYNTGYPHFRKALDLNVHSSLQSTSGLLEKNTS